MAYATVEDVQERLQRQLTQAEQVACTALLSDAAAIIDTLPTNATAEIKKIVSCRMVMRAIGDGTSTGVPMGATQGSMSALGYVQSWTIGSGANGELYLSKLEKQMLGAENAIGSYSPVQELVGCKS